MNNHDQLSKDPRIFDTRNLQAILQSLFSLLLFHISFRYKQSFISVSEFQSKSLTMIIIASQRVHEFASNSPYSSFNSNIYIHRSSTYPKFQWKSLSVIIIGSQKIHESASNSPFIFLIIPLSYAHPNTNNLSTPTRRIPSYSKFQWKSLTVIIISSQKVHEFAGNSFFSLFLFQHDIHPSLLQISTKIPDQNKSVLKKFTNSRHNSPLHFSPHYSSFNCNTTYPKFQWKSLTWRS